MAEKDLDDIPIGTWHFYDIRMQDFSASDMLTTGPLGLLPFVPFMGGANEQLAEQAMWRITQDVPEDEAETLAFVLAVFIAQVYKSADLARSIVRRVLMSTDLFRESPLFRELMSEERLQNSHELAQVALEGRFQTLSADILQALGTADEATLKAIVAHVSSDTMEQMRARLGLGPQG